MASKFPDLTGDGKVTQADILKGRGVEGMKKGGKTGYASGGLAAGHKAADGIAKKGKTKAMQVKMAGGGMCK